MSRQVHPRRVFVRARENVNGLRSRRGFWPALEQVEDRVLLSANTYTVNSLGDAGTGLGLSGDLRYAITQANSNAGSAIVFGVSGTIQLGRALPEIAANLSINGPGAGTLTVQGGGSTSNFSVLTIHSGVSASISGLTIAGGHATAGGGISNAGTLSLFNSVISSNTATTSGGGISNTGTLSLVRSKVSGDVSGGTGGGISNAGTLSLTDDTLSGNTATGKGGGVFNASTGSVSVLDSTVSSNTASSGGGIANAGTLLLMNSTAWGNTSSTDGGGVSNTGIARVTNATLTSNRAAAGFGGGFQNTGAGEVLLSNTLIAGNHSGGSTSTRPGDLQGVFAINSSFNLVGDGDHQSGLANGSQGNQVGSASVGTVINAGLLPLGNRGGITQTVALLPTSPALSMGSVALAVNPVTGQALTTDQRGPGFARVINGGVDIGAYQSQTTPTGGPIYTVNSLGDTGTGTGTKGDLRYAITQANSHPGSTIVFTVTGTIQLQSVLPDLGADVTIAGPGRDSLIVRFAGNQKASVFVIPRGMAASISNLTLSNGQQGSDISNAGTLRLSNTRLTGSKAIAGALTNSGNAALTNVTVNGNSGTGIANTGNLTLLDSDITGNTVTVVGATIDSSSGQITIANTTIAGNTSTATVATPFLVRLGNTTATFTNVTLSGNVIHGNDEVNNYVILAGSSYVTMANVTISGNTGGAIRGGNVALSLANTTITGNTGIGLSFSKPNLSPYNYNVILENCLIAGNSTGGSSPNVDVVGKADARSSGNLIGNGDSLTGIANGSQNNQIGSATAGTIINPHVAPLADNGGPTQTEALLAGSSAIDAGVNVGAVNPFTNAPLPGDQRGPAFSRIVHGAVDIGAYELQGSPAIATHLVSLVPPPSPVYAGNNFNLVIAAEDASGNIDASFNGLVTLSLGASPGGSTLGGTLTVRAVNGVANFAGLTLDKPGNGYSIVATAAGLPQTTISEIDVQHAVATHLVFTPVRFLPVTAGVAFGMGVAVADAMGHVDTSFSGNVTLSTPLPMVLHGTTTLPIVNGVANFTGLTLNIAALTLASVVTATIPGVFKIETAPLKVIAAPATHLALSNLGPTVTSMTNFDLLVSPEDDFGNLDLGFAGIVTVAIANNPGGGTLTIVTMAVSHDKLDFTLTLDKVGAGYTLQATTPGLPTAVSNAFNVIHGVAIQLLVTTQPPSGIKVGQSFGLTVSAADAGGNVVPGITGNVALALASNPGGAVLGGTTTVAAVNSVATFSGLTLDKSGNGYTLRATSSGFQAGVTLPFNVVPASSPKVVVTTEPPSNVHRGEPFGFTASVEDSAGNVESTFNGPVTVALLSNPGSAALGGTLTVMAVNGVATFSGLTLDQNGNGYILSASSPGSQSAVTSSFNVSLAPIKLVIASGPPSEVAANTPFGLTVDETDSQGQVITTFNGPITVALANNPGGATLGGTLTVTAVNGVATFSGLTLNKAAQGYTLHASTAGVSAVTTTRITVTPGAATHLVVTVQPPSSINPGTPFGLTVAAEDDLGNVDTSYASGDAVVALATSPSGATLGGVLTRTVENGMTIFSGLTLDTFGSYTLQVTSDGLTKAVSQTIQVPLAPATHLMLAPPPPSTVSAGEFFGFTVNALNQLGGLDTSYNGNVTVTLSGGPSGTAVIGTTTVKAVNGIATFSGLKVNKAGNSYTLHISSGALTSATAPLAVTASTSTLHVVSITPAVGTYNALPNSQIVVTFSQPLAGFTPDVASGGGFANNYYAVYLVPRGPGGVFAAPSGLDGGSTPLHATLVYHVNANNTSTITLIPREPLGTDIYLISVSGTINGGAGKPLVDANGNGGTQFQTFEIKVTTPNSTPLKVVSVTTQHASVNITNGATIVQPDTITIAFSKPVNFLQLNTTTVQLLAGPSNTPIQAAVAYSPTTKTVYLTPEVKLNPGTKYTIRVAGSVSDDQGFPNPDTAFTLGSTFTRSFMVKGTGVGPGSSPLMALSKNGHLLASPGFGSPRTTPFGYASIPFSETVDMSSLKRYSVRLVPQKGGLNNNGPDVADAPLNAKLAFNPNTNTLIIVPTVPIGNDVYRYYLAGFKAKNGDVLTGVVSDTFSVSIPAAKPSVVAQVKSGTVTSLVAHAGVSTSGSTSSSTPASQGSTSSPSKVVAIRRVAQALPKGPTRFGLGSGG